MKSKPKFDIRQAPKELVKKFWLSSGQAVVFNNPDVVATLSDDHSWWIACKGDEPFLVWPVHLGKNKKPALPPFAYFFGPMWSPVAESRPMSSVYADRLCAYNEMVEFLISRFGGVANSLHPSLTDIRAFSWWGHKTEQYFEVNPRFTAQILDLQSKSSGQLLSSYRELRRREVKKVEHSLDYTVVSSVEEGVVKSLYAATFEKQGQAPCETDMSAIQNLLRLVEKGYGFIVGAQSNVSKEVDCMTLVLSDGTTANMVLNLTNPAKVGLGIGAWTIHKTIEKSQEVGLQTFDFNGANSPMRADDKHSYGASEVLFFTVNYSVSKYD